jgi:hypothetical protein
MLNELERGLGRRERRARKRAFDGARTYIERAQRYGYSAPASEKFEDPNGKPGDRVDIEVREGRAFTW